MMPQMPKKLTPQQAKALLIAKGIDFRQDFDALRSSTVQEIVDTAKLARYRKSKNAPGSTGRMFYQYLSRVAPATRREGELTPAERRAYQARARKATHHSTVKTPPAQLDREIAAVTGVGAWKKSDQPYNSEHYDVGYASARVKPTSTYSGADLRMDDLDRSGWAARPPSERRGSHARWGQAGRACVASGECTNNITRR